MSRAKGPADLTVFFPAWNECELIAEAVEEASAALASLQEAGQIDSYELLVVDDGSTDGTPDILDEFSARIPSLTVVRHRENRGVGPAMRTGFGLASGRLVFYTDADLPVDLSALSGMLETQRRTGADIVTGYRTTRRYEPLKRQVYGICYNLLVRGVLGVHFRDVNFAAKLITAELLSELDLRSESIFIDAELLSLASRSGKLIVEYPLDYRPRTAGVSTTSSMRQIRALLKELIVRGPSIRRAGRHDPR